MIIFLSGSINSGKTTIAGLLKKQFPHSAHIEVDTINDMYDWMPLEDAIPLNLKNALSLTQNFIEEKIDVIITYPLSRDEYEYFNKTLPLEIQRFFFTLNPRLDHALANRGTRELSEWEIERIKYHYKTGVNNPGFGVTIDNTMQTPEETLNDILYHIEQREIRYKMED